MRIEYQVWLTDTAGNRQALFMDRLTGGAGGIPHSLFSGLRYTHLQGKAGILSMDIEGRNRWIPEFIDGCQILVLRRNRDTKIGTVPSPLAWYTEFAGFYDGQTRYLDENGRKRCTVNAIEYLDLCWRERIAYDAYTTYTDKSGAGETAIKSFVDQNIGPGAGGADRWYSGIRTGLTIEADGGRGSLWEGACAHDNLGDSIAKIAALTGLTFDIVATGAATFEFRVYEGQRGSDRSTVGIDATTGLNAAGNSPIVFSDQRNNIASASYTKTYRNSKNRIMVLGTGEGAARNYAIRTSADAALSPWSPRVNSIDASQAAFTATALNNRGDIELKNQAAKDALKFVPLQTPTNAYGKHYHWGDVVTGQFDEIVSHKTLIGVKVTLNESGETIDHDFADVIGY